MPSFSVLPGLKAFCFLPCHWSLNRKPAPLNRSKLKDQHYAKNSLVPVRQLRSSVVSGERHSEEPFPPHIEVWSLELVWCLVLGAWCFFLRSRRHHQRKLLYQPHSE